MWHVSSKKPRISWTLICQPGSRLQARKLGLIGKLVANQEASINNLYPREKRKRLSCPMGRGRKFPFRLSLHSLTGTQLPKPLFFILCIRILILCRRSIDIGSTVCTIHLLTACYVPQTPTVRDNWSDSSLSDNHVELVLTRKCCSSLIIDPWLAKFGCFEKLTFNFCTR